jgi:hypothetical protein
MATKRIHSDNIIRSLDDFSSDLMDRSNEVSRAGLPLDIARVVHLMFPMSLRVLSRQAMSKKIWKAPTRLSLP